MVAKNIEKYLKDHGIMAAWLARQLNIPKTTLYSVFNGSSQLKADMFIQICRILKVSPETFVEVQDEHRKDA